MCVCVRVCVCVCARARVCVSHEVTNRRDCVFHMRLHEGLYGLYEAVSHVSQAEIGHQSWQHEASDRDSWRSSVRKTSRMFEAERHEA